MMKRLITLLLTFALLLSVATVASAANEQAAADALHSLGLFLGTGDVDGKPVYELDGKLTRAHAIVLFVRMLGKQEAAENGTWAHPFTDTAAWYEKHVGYGYVNGYTKGTGAKTYGGTAATDGKMFATFCMRALGYADKASADASTGDFWWEDAPTFAKTLGVGVSANASFTRGNAVETFWALLSAKLKGSEQTLAEKLIADGVFTEAQYKAAQKTAQGATGTNELPEIDIKPSSNGHTGGSIRPANPTPTTPQPGENELPEIEIP